MATNANLATFNPYVGPRPFEIGEKIFGRDREITELRYLLSAERIVLLHSPSGAGKSSLVNAGLVPELKRRFDVWRPTRVNQQPTPGFKGGNRYIMSAAMGLEQELPEHLRRAPETLAAQGLQDYVKSRPRRPQVPKSVVLIFDQFEEILQTDPADIAEKREFFRQLGELLLAPQIWALIVLREDYLAPLDPYCRLVPTHLKNRYRIDLLGLDAAREAIKRPALESGRPFQDEAAEKLIRDLATMKAQQLDGTFVDQAGHNVEPLQLQVVCHGLWERMPEKLSIDLDDVVRFANITDALSGYYSSEVKRIAGDDVIVERAMRAWVGHKLITPDGIRGQVLKGTGKSEGLNNDLIERLVNTHLVRGEQRSGATWYELTHDRLIEPVRSDNSKWLEKKLSYLQRQANLWEGQHRPKGLLLCGDELTEAERWASSQPKLEHWEQAFLAESQEARAELQRAQEALARERLQTRRLRIALARSYIRDAEPCLETGRPDQALAHLARALGLDPESIGASSRISDLLIRRRWWLPSKLMKHKKAVVSAAFSANGRRLVTASWDNTARVWEVDTGWPVFEVPLQHQGALLSAAFSPDGNYVVTASVDGTARVWEADTGKPVVGPLQHTRPVRSAAFSVGGRLVVTASEDHTARVWAADTGRAVGPPLQHKGPVWSAAFSPDGRHVVTASHDGSARLWVAESGEPVGAALQHNGSVYSAAFSADGRRVVTASQDGTARVWEADTGEAVGPPLQHNGPPVYSAAFSGDGRRVVTASEDKTAQVWDIDTGRPAGAPLQHKAVVSSAAFSADGRRVVTASADNSARVWDTYLCAPTGAPMQHFGEVRAASFSPDGQRVLTASLDNSARVWVDAFEPAGDPMKHRKEVCSAFFSPDGRRVVTASKENTARVWDAHTGKLVGPVMKHSGPVWSAKFSADGRRVVTASEDKTGQVWEADTGKRVGMPLQHKEGVVSAEFSTDGRRVVTASLDKTSQVWDADSGKPVGPSLQHKGIVFSAEFGADGRRVVTASWKSAKWKAAQVWETDTGVPVGPPLQHRGPVWSAKFSADGRRVVTASADHTAQVWEADAGAPVGAPLQHNSQVNSAVFSPDGLRVVTVSDDHTAQVWEADTSKPVGAPLQHNGPVVSAEFSLDGRRVVTASWDNTARVWEADTGKPVGAPLQHKGPLKCAVFSADGRRVVTASTDKTAQVWAVLLGSGTEQDTALLADLAQAVGGASVNEFDALVPLEDQAERLQKLRWLANQEPDQPDTMAGFIRRFLSILGPLSPTIQLPQ